MAILSPCLIVWVSGEPIRWRQKLLYDHMVLEESEYLFSKRVRISRVIESTNKETLETAQN